MAKVLRENKGKSFFGLCLAGAFVIPGTKAREWLVSPNPHGRSSAEVLRPIYNGKDITERFRDRWVIDFGISISELEAEMYELPYAYLQKHVKEVRSSNREKSRVARWWIHGRSRPELRSALKGLNRYIVTPETSKHRVFCWLPIAVAPEHKLVVIPSEDESLIGILSSRFHVSWALRLGGRLQDRPVYSKERCFDTFPFLRWKEPNTNSDALAIAESVRQLIDLRNRWLNPPELLQVVPEVTPGFPDRLVPVNSEADKELKRRTMTALYNANPAWLRNANAKLDKAVASAYGWPEGIGEDDALKRLLALNLEIAAKPPTF